MKFKKEIEGPTSVVKDRGGRNVIIYDRDTFESDREYIQEKLENLTLL